MSKFIAVSQPESCERKDMFIFEFESANRSHARRFIMENLDRNLVWVFFRKPINESMPRAEIIKRG